MKHHLITSLVILIGLLSFGLWSTCYLGQQTQRTQNELGAAFPLAAAGELERAHRHTEKAAAAWKKASRLAACLAEHQVLDQIESLFGELEAWVQVDNPQQYTAALMRLSVLLNTLADGERPFFHNLF